MKVTYKVLSVFSIVLMLLLGACGTANARGQMDIERGDVTPPGDGSATVSESHQAEVGVPGLEEPLSAQDPEGVPSIEERNEMLGGVNLGIDQPAADETPTGPEPGSETGPPGSTVEVPTTELDDVNLGIEQSEDTSTNLFEAILSTIRQFFSSIFGSTETSEAYIG